MRTGAETLALLREHKRELVDRFGVAGLALFGSSVRDEVRSELRPYVEAEAVDV
ncbi:hypothetical protein [Candidatus Poriferisodalis sp.]|uniref:hypothetical protein n=1 Tax=Candidatus Poriferisodalis sp. TaxID=3101277 RepID=UPI003B0224AC